MTVVLWLVIVGIGCTMALQLNSTSSNQTRRSLSPGGHQPVHPIVHTPTHQIHANNHLHHPNHPLTPHHRPNPSHDAGKIQVASPAEMKHSSLVRLQLQRAIAHKDFAVVPIIYIAYGKLPDYLYFSIEVTRRTNRIVVVISDVFSVYSSDVQEAFVASKAAADTMDAFYDAQPSIVFQVPMSEVSAFREAFQALYEPVGVELSAQHYEYICIERWLVFGNFLETFEVDRGFFADTDVILLSSMSRAFEDRRQCDAVMIVENLAECSKIQPLGAVNGHTTLWTQRAALDWRTFLIALYRDFRSSVTLSGVQLRPHKSPLVPNRICDMNLLWLYWASRTSHLPIGYATGRAYLIAPNAPGEAEALKRSVDAMYVWARKLPLPPLPSDNSTVALCNGLDVVKRTVFDHMRGYSLPTFSANLPNIPSTSAAARAAAAKTLSRHVVTATPAAQADAAVVVGEHRPESGTPHITGVCSPSGGIPETLDEKEQKEQQLSEKPIYLLSIHYQGGDKRLIAPDACRIALRARGNAEARLVVPNRNGSGDGSDTPYKALPKGTVYDASVLDRCRRLLSFDDVEMERQCIVGFPGAFNHNVDINRPKYIV